MLDRNQRKKELRRQINEKIDQLGEAYCRQADAAICQHIIELPDYQSAGTVFCFVGTQREICTNPILQDALTQGKRLGVPRCIAKGKMEVFQIKSLDDLQEGSYGILEPKPECPKIPPQEIDFGVIPCVSCDRQGHRLGHGGGYYDRYLQNCGFPMAVICREELLCDEIPTMEHDIHIQFVVTEKGVFASPEKD